MNFRHYIQHIVRGGDYLRKLILANVSVFVLLFILSITAGLVPEFSVAYRRIADSLAIPASFSEFIYQPWSLISFMFINKGFFNTLFAMLWLFWMGSILQDFLGTRKLLITYFWGGICSAVVFLAVANLIPGIHENVPLSGAALSIMAVVAAAATLVPAYEIQLFIFGRIRLKWLAIAYIVLDLLFVPPPGIAAYSAHAAAALFGFSYVYNLKHHTFAGDTINGIISFFRSFRIKSASKKAYQSRTGMYSTAGYDDDEEDPSQEVIDAILDKISQSGYKSLSEKEKQILFKASKQS